MIIAQVHHVKLGHPPEGMKSIVWADGRHERSMLIDSKDGWEVSIVIDDDESPRRTYCVETSPGMGEIRVTRMTQKELPKKISLMGSEVSNTASELTPEAIVLHTMGMYE